MTSILPIKSSSRAGRFKKKLVIENLLPLEAREILPKLAPFHELFSSSQISQSDFTAAYLLTYLSHRFPGTWLGARKEHKSIEGIRWRDLPFTFEKNIQRRLQDCETLGEIFSGFALKSTPLAVNRAILEWSRGNYQLELMFRIPSAREVLDQQKMGRRCVTTLMDQRIAKYVLGERDSLSFTMHDLIHADHFYFSNSSYQGQLGFYGLLDETFSYFDLTLEKFAAEFEYLIADMNAYAIHLLKCLKSAMVHYFSEDYFKGWIQNLDAPSSLSFLNTEAYRPEVMDQEILDWLDRYRRI